MPYLTAVHPLGFICSDGGGGRDLAGTAGLALVENQGLAGATVDARTARMGSGMSTWNDGVISACNVHATAAGVRVGMSRPGRRHLLVRRTIDENEETR